jgi:hypothetical protein
MKVTHIVAESTKKPVSEAPVSGLAQFGKKVLAKTAAKVGARDFAAGVAGNVDTGAEANNLRKAWQNHQGATGGSMKANDPVEFKNWLMQNGFKDKGKIIDAAIASASGAGKGAVAPGDVVKSKSGQDVLAGVDGNPTVIKPTDEKGKAEILALAKKKGIKTAGGAKAPGGPFNKKVLDAALLQIVQNSKKAAPQDADAGADQTAAKAQAGANKNSGATAQDGAGDASQDASAQDGAGGEIPKDILDQINQCTDNEKNYIINNITVVNTGAPKGAGATA